MRLERGRARRHTMILAAFSLGASAVLLLGAGCNDHVVSPSGPQGRNVVVVEGTDAILATGDRVHFDRVETDSRCPRGVECFWEGEAKASFSLRTGGVNTPFTLVLHGSLVAADTLQGMVGFQPVDVGHYRMTLLQLDPYPVAGMNLKLRSTALIRVEY